MKRDIENYLKLGRSFVQNHYRTEASKTAAAAKAEKITTLYRFKDFFENNIFGWIKHYLKSRFGPKHYYLAYNSDKHPSLGKYTFHNKTKIALVSDWATDTEEADVIGEEIRKQDPDFTIHLGDTYYVGAGFEIKGNFIDPGCSWHKGKSGSFALLGNHEMYARGVSYFRDLLPALGVSGENGQGASYFCLQNEHWVILGIDTGYNSVGIPIIEYLPWFKPDCRLENLFLKWLNKNFDLRNDNRGIVLLSHHQYYSAFEGQYIKPAQQLAELIGYNRTVLWFWGHEHRLSIYGQNKVDGGLNAFGRCIGHGGMPIELFDEKKIKNQKALESKLVLFDNRKFRKVENLEVGHNGYVILTIDGPELAADYFDEKELLITETWASDISTGKIAGKSISVKNPELNSKPHLYSENIIMAIQ